MNMTIKQKQKIILDMVKEFDRTCKENGIQYTLVAGSILGAIRHQGFIPWDSDMDVLVPINQFDLLREKLKNNLSESNYILHEWDKEPKYAEVVDRLSPKNVDHETVHLDIFPIIGAPSDIKKQKRFANICYYSYKILRCKHCNTNYSKKNHIRTIKAIRLFTLLIPDKAILAWYHRLQKKYPYDKAEYVHILASGYGLVETQKKSFYLDTKYVPFEDTKLRIPKKAIEYLKLIYGDDYMIPKKDGYKKIDKK